MAHNLNTLYPGKVTVDVNNPNGTFKNRTSDALKDGTPFEREWASDVWGFLSHILAKGGISPSGAEENETVSQYYDTLETLLGRISVQWDVEDLQIDYTGNTTVHAAFKSLSLLDSNYYPKFLRNKDLTWTMPADLEAGTSEKSSCWYDMWLDSDENLVLAPRLTGTTTSTVAGYLADSGATLLTDLVHAGDIAQNLTTGVLTTVSADATANGQVAVTDDIFTVGQSYQIIKLSPIGLGANTERIGMVYNNASGNFSNSGYLKPWMQNWAEYSEENGDTTFTGGAVWATQTSRILLEQVLSPSMNPQWYVSWSVRGTVTASTYNTITLTGVTFLQYEALSHYAAIGAHQDGAAYTIAASSTFYYNSNLTSTDKIISGKAKISAKPTWATRS